MLDHAGADLDTVGPEDPDENVVFAIERLIAGQVQERRTYSLELRNARIRHAVAYASGRHFVVHPFSFGTRLDDSTGFSSNADLMEALLRWVPGIKHRGGLGLRFRPAPSELHDRAAGLLVADPAAKLHALRLGVVADAGAHVPPLRAPPSGPQADGGRRSRKLFQLRAAAGRSQGLADLFLRVRIDARLLNGPFVMIFCHIGEPSSRKAAGAIKPWLELHRDDKHFIQCRHAEALPAHDGRSHWARLMLSMRPVVRRHCNDADAEAHLFMSFWPPRKDVTLGQTLLIVGRQACGNGRRTGWTGPRRARACSTRSSPGR